MFIDIDKLEKQKQLHYNLAGYEDDLESELKAYELLYSKLSPEQIEMKDKIDLWIRQGIA